MPSRSGSLPEATPSIIANAAARSHPGLPVKRLVAPALSLAEPPRIDLILAEARGRWLSGAAGVPVGLLAPGKMPIPLCRLRDGGVPRRPGGLPHNFRSIPDIGQSRWHWG